jgi:hypothetical protein
VAAHVRLTQKRLAQASGVNVSTIKSRATGASLPRDPGQLTAVGVFLFRCFAAGQARAGRRLG